MKMKVDQFISQHNHYNYCEIIILPDGYIMKAIPSHTEVLIKLWCDKNLKNREELCDILQESTEPVLHFICDDLQCISVWYSNMYIPSSKINPIQLDVLHRLIDAKCVDEIVLTLIP